MLVELTAKGIVVTLPTSVNIADEEVQRFLNYLRYKELVSQSKATQTEIDQLAREVNSSWWKKNKHLFLPEE